jgi:hypothetical protein
MPPLGIDVAWQRPSPDAIRSAGYSFVIGYLSTDPTKNLTAQNITAYQAQSLGILLVWETTARRVLDGMAAGIADGRAANAQAAAFGYPPDVPIFFACDMDTTALVARPYFRGVTTVRPCSGAYGDIAVVDALLADGTVRFGWQTSAWSGQSVSTAAHLYQRTKPTLPLQGSFDEDVLLRPIPMFTAPIVTPASNPQPAPAPLIQGAPDMRVIRNTDNGRCYLAGVGTVQWLETVPQLNTWLRLCGQTSPEPVTTVDLADFAHTNPREEAA